MKKINTIIALGVIVLTTLSACFGGRSASVGRGGRGGRSRRACLHRAYALRNDTYKARLPQDGYGERRQPVGKADSGKGNIG